MAILWVIVSLPPSGEKVMTSFAAYDSCGLTITKLPSFKEGSIEPDWTTKSLGSTGRLSSNGDSNPEVPIGFHPWGGRGLEESFCDME